MVKVFTKSLLIAAMGYGLFSCVPARQFQELQMRQHSYEHQLDSVKESNRTLSEQSIELGSRVQILDKQVDEMSADTLALGRRLRLSRERFRRCSDQNRDLMKRQSSLSRGNDQETRELLLQIQKTQDDLRVREDEVLALEREMDVRKRKLDSMKGELDQRNARLAELQKILDQKDRAVNELKGRVSEALTGFEDKGLTIQIRNGKVYVSMDEKLLFQSGRYDVDPKGVVALKKLGVVLAQNSDIHVMIEGHTDDVPYHGKGVLLDNWDLSVKRATSIVRILVANKGIDPQRLAVAGRSRYAPVSSGKTPEARRKNRRTEIILTPKLDKLFRILNSH